MEVYVIIAGSRSFNDYNLLVAELDKELSNFKEPRRITIITGAARGADRLGSSYAQHNGYELKEFPANWNKYGRSAGYIRNKEMIDYIMQQNGERLLVVFWDGYSVGTNNIITLAKERGIKVKIITFST